MTPELMTIAEACELFGVCPRTIAKWYDEGRLAGHRLPGPRGPRRLERSSVMGLARELGIVNPCPEIPDGT